MKAFPRYSLLADTSFMVAVSLLFLLLFAVARGLLLWRNQELLAVLPAADLYWAFAVGLRFDLSMTSYALAPLAIAMLFPAGLGGRRWVGYWLRLLLAVCAFLAVAELDFYHEFHTRLNSLAFQYLREDPRTVTSMLWHGFPVLRYLLLWALLVAGSWWALGRIDRMTHWSGVAPTYWRRLLVALVLLCIVPLAARGTLRQGPPLRWGDAVHSSHPFANHLALNGVFSLSRALLQMSKAATDNRWLRQLPAAQALATLREHWLLAGETLVAPDTMPLLRRGPLSSAREPFRQVVVILMESFAGQYMGALGNPLGITPAFDALAAEGVLFDHLFSNGTHTHQGMFASLACFPNLPDHEFLMQQTEGSYRFSGLGPALTPRGYHSVYVYNGDFHWDNQFGFFRGQGVQHFVGRHDFINPRLQDPTWGVSDEDMFDRALLELAALEATGEPYFAILQSLSNHTPYALPTPLPVAAVNTGSELDQHLTAMRYSDYALGQFFAGILAMEGFDDTLFVILGDHGFAGERQVTSMDLQRYHVPLLLLGRGLQARFGPRRSVVGSQVDVVPTVLGLLGGGFTQHCWGRDLLALAADDPGQAVIKPSGSDQTVAMIEGDHILVESPDLAPVLYRYQLSPVLAATVEDDGALSARLDHRLKAFIQVATQALLADRVGQVPP